MLTDVSLDVFEHPVSCLGGHNFGISLNLDGSSLDGWNPGAVSRGWV